LAIKGPNALDPGVSREGTEMGMIGGCQVLIDRVSRANFVACKVTNLRQGSFFVAEDEVASCEVRELDNHGARTSFFGRDHEGLINQEGGWAS
jgi:hypothetical protein